MESEASDLVSSKTVSDILLGPIGLLSMFWIFHQFKSSDASSPQIPPSTSARFLMNSTAVSRPWGNYSISHAEGLGTKIPALRNPKTDEEKKDAAKHFEAIRRWALAHPHDMSDQCRLLKAYACETPCTYFLEQYCQASCNLSGPADGDDHHPGSGCVLDCQKRLPVCPQFCFSILTMFQTLMSRSSYTDPKPFCASLAEEYHLVDDYSSSY